MTEETVYISRWDTPPTKSVDFIEGESEEEKEERLRKEEEEERLRLLEEEKLRIEEEKLQEETVYKSRWESVEPVLGDDASEKETVYKSRWESNEPFFKESTTSASDISDPELIDKKISYGWAQEPTIAGSLWRLGKAGLKSLVSNQTYAEVAKEIEAARQEEIRKDFPELFGKEEDAWVLAGRMGLAVADPVTFFLPWAKAAKAGKISVAALGSSVAVGDVALREKALYGEVRGSSLALAASLGGVSSVLGSMLLPAQRGGRETFETIGENGFKVKKVINIGDEFFENPLLKIRKRKKLVEEASKFTRTGEEILGRHGTIIENLLNSNKNAGFHYTQNTIINKHIKILEQELSIAKNKVQGLPTAEVTRIEKELLKANEKFDLNQDKLEKILFEQLPQDFGDAAFIQFNTALKNGIFKEEGVPQWLMQELTSPIIGSAGGFAFGVTTADEDNTMSYVWGSMLIGAGLGQLRKNFNRANYSLQDMSKVNQFLKEGEQIYKRSYLSVGKNLLAGTHAAKLQAGIDSVRSFGAKLFNLQGGGLKQDTVLGESVEEAKHIQLNIWSSVALGEIIGNRNQATVRAAGRILNEKNMSVTSKSSFLQKGDLENSEAAKLADELEKFTNEFKKYVESVGIQFTETEQYGLTQLLRKDLQLNLKETTEELTSAFKIQFTNDWRNKKLQLQSKGEYRGRYVHIEDLDKTGTNVRSYTRSYIDDTLGDGSKNGWAKDKATRYINGQTQERRHSLWADDIDFLDEASLKQKMFRDSAKQEEDVIITAARHFDNQRVLYDQEARAFLANKDYFEDDPLLTLQALIHNTVPVVEFARVFGAKGEGLQAVFSGIKKEINLKARKAKGKGTFESNKSLQLLAKAQIQDVKNSVDAYFGMYQIDRAYKKDAMLNVVVTLQTILSTTKLTKVALPSLGDLIQTFKNSGFSAARESAIKQMARRRGEDTWVPSEVLGLRGKRPVGDQYSSDTSVSDIIWNKRLYNGLLHREMKNWMVERFFEIVQLGRITRFAREFAYDAGAIRAWQLSQKLNKKGTLPKRFKKDAARLGLDTDSLKYLNKFKSLDEIEGNILGEKLISRAGFKSAERDALIPTVGNRRLFAQSRDPGIRFLGSFLSWAQAKTSQTNALISRVESGDAALAIRMLAALPIFMAVRELQLDLNSSDTFKKDVTVSTSPDISSDLKRIGDGIIFSAEVMPWYLDKGINTLRGYGTDTPVTSLSPVLGLMNALTKEGSQTVIEGIPSLIAGDTDDFISGAIGSAENAIPFFKDLNRSKGFLNPTLDIMGKPVGMSLEDWLKGNRYGPLKPEYEFNPLELEYNYKKLELEPLFKGGAVSKDHPVPKAPVIPMERKDRMGDQSYATQASAEPINPFTGEPYTAIYKR